MPFGRPFWTFLRRFFRNESSAPLLANPYAIAGGKSAGEDSPARPRFVFLQILFDLFVIAALQIFSNERALISGIDIASFIAFFTIIWTIWASQAIFDLRFRTGHDILSLLFLFIQLVVFGVLASNAEAFDIALGLIDSHDQSVSEGSFRWVQPIKAETSSIDDRYDALRWVSAAYGVSRLAMAVRYGIVALQAKRYHHSPRPIVILIGGLLLNATFWFGAFACDFFQNETCAIVRTVLWCLGWTAEFATSLISIRSTKLSPRDSAFLLQRYASLTIIVVGEGVFGLFRSFSSAIQGPQGTPSSGVLGVLVASIYSYLALYYLYYGHRTEHLRSSVDAQLAWALLHFPMHLFLLLTFQAVNYNIEGITVLESWPSLFDSASQSLIEIFNRYNASGNTSTTAQLYQLTTTSALGQTMNELSHDVGINRPDTLQLGAYLAATNATLFFQYVSATTLSSFLRLFELSRFKPSHDTYQFFNDVVDTGFLAYYDSNSDLQTQVYQWYIEGIYNLYQEIYYASLFGFGVLGGYLICLAAAAWLQVKTLTKYSGLSMVFRLICGVTLAGLSGLNAGGFTLDTSDDDGTVAQMVLLVYSNWFVPAMLLAASIPIIFDTAIFLWKHAQQDSRIIRQQRASIYIDKAVDLHGN